MNRNVQNVLDWWQPICLKAKRQYVMDSTGGTKAFNHALMPHRNREQDSAGNVQLPMAFQCGVTMALRIGHHEPLAPQRVR